MGIMRVAKNANYTVMNRTALNDTRLSWKAKGIIAYMLSMPDDWVFYVEELTKHATDGEKSLRAGFKELKECGYVERKPIREGQRIKEWETIVHEVPQDNSLLSGFVHVENVDVQKLQVGSVDVQNDRLLSTDINQLLNIPNTNRLLNTDNYQQDVAATTVSGGSLIDSQFAEILNLIRKNLRPLSPFQAEQLGYSYDQYGYELTLEATKEMLSAKDVRKPIPYIESILFKWKEQGVSNLQNLKLYRERGESYGTNQSISTKEYSDGVNF